MTQTTMRKNRSRGDIDMKTSIIGLFKKISICIAILLIAAVGAASALTDQEQLGKFLFTDINLSTPVGQSCQDCHVPAVAFTEPDKSRGVSEGIIGGRFGNRNAPSSAYAAFTPELGLV